MKQAFLHFHEDPAGMFADVLHAGKDMRFCVNAKREQKALLAYVDAIVTAPVESKRPPSK